MNSRGYKPVNIGLGALGRALNPAMRRAFRSYASARNARMNISGRTRLSRGRTRTIQQYRRQTRSGSGTLGGTNADRRLVYRKKSMPRRKKRRWKSFVKRVNFIKEKDLGSRTVLFNDFITISSAVATEQVCLTTALYGFGSAPSPGYLRDLTEIGTLENTGNPTAVAGETVDGTTKYMFQSAIMDMTIRNTSYVKESNERPIVLDAAAQIELDIYEVMLRMDSNDVSTDYVTLSAVLNAYDEKDIGGTGLGIGISDRGATPWECVSALSNFKIKILKKTKYFIPNGQTITHQTRDPRRHVIPKNQLSVQDGWYRPGWTKCYFMIAKLVPGLDIGTGIGQYTCRLAVGSTRKYLYKIEGMNDTRERRLGASYTLTNPA